MYRIYAYKPDDFKPF